MHCTMPNPWTHVPNLIMSAAQMAKMKHIMKTHTKEFQKTHVPSLWERRNVVSLKNYGQRSLLMQLCKSAFVVVVVVAWPAPKRLTGGVQLSLCAIIRGFRGTRVSIKQ